MGSSSHEFEIVERDEAGNITSTYIGSGGSTSPGGSTRVDQARPKQVKTYLQRIVDVFLPAGYPHSVTEDYIHYQLYDSLQAFSSSIAGLLASRAVLEGVGVGDASASPTAALLLSILQESTGRVATILFAHKLGKSLEPECKRFRLLADIFNDAAMILDCLSPAFPKVGRVLLLSISSTLRALCGVCAGSAKASLSAHFATKGNLGELNAKDSSQETVISLLGMLAGSAVVSWVSTPMATWATLIALLSIHLGTNYAAVTAVELDSMNRQRANIVLSQILEDGAVLRPTDVSKRERIFERDGVLRWTDDRAIGHCSIGVPLDVLLHDLSLNGPVARSHSRKRALQVDATALSQLMRLYEHEAYILWFAQSRAIVVLKDGCSPTDQLKAWGQALLLAQRRRLRTIHDGERRLAVEDSLAEMQSTLEASTKLFDTYTEKLREAGWDLEATALETRAGFRVTAHDPVAEK